MKRYAPLTLVLAFAIGGCLPKRVLFWSPDGQRAAVITPDGLCLADPTGKLGPSFAKNVELVAWFPDSRHFVAERAESASDWKEIETALVPERRDKVKSFADKLRAELTAFEGDWNKFKPSFASELSDGELVCLYVYIRDRRNEGLAEKLGPRWEELKSLVVLIHHLQMYEVSDGIAKAGTLLARTVDGFQELRVSPKGTVVACVEGISGGEHPVFRLSVVSTKGGPLRQVAQPAAMFPDWKPDGESVVYTTTHATGHEMETIQLGSVAQRRVCDSGGELLPEFGIASEDIGVMFWPYSKLRCLADGRILFASMEVSLPVPKDDMPERTSLFVADPTRSRTVSRVLSREAEARLPDGLALGCFQLSPDQKRMMVCSAGKTNVVVVTLATSEVVEVVADKEADLKGFPAWRTSEELAVPVPPKARGGSATRSDYVIWSGPDKVRCLSCDWPDLFPDPNPPATAPHP